MKEDHQRGTNRPNHLSGGCESLAARIIAAQEEERARIARDLHDDICQQLSLLAMDLQQLRFGLSQSEARTAIDEALRKVGSITSDIHSVSHRLHPSMVRDLGVTAAIKAECGHFAARHGIPVNFKCDLLLGAIAEENGLALFRIVQEALHNVAKHAKASDVHVSLDRSADDICLRIEDSGIGFDPEQPQIGLGLASMRERTALAHGSLAISSAPSRGTVVEVIVPAGLASTSSPIG